MKKISLYLLFCTIATLLFSCDKYDSNIKNPEQYANVYMPRANYDPIQTPVTQDTKEFHFNYSAYLGGIILPKNNTTVNFGVNPALLDSFNLSHGTDYKLLPATNYTIGSPTAIIGAGRRSTDSLNLTVESDSHLNLFETYLLPLSITSVDGDGSVSAVLNTTYYIFSVGFPAGQVPREKVLSLGSDFGGIYCGGPKNSLITNSKTSFDILLNLPDNDGVFNAPALHIGLFWNASESFYYVNESSMLVRNAPDFSGLFNFIIHPENVTQSNPNPESNIIFQAPNFWLGDHWNAFKIVPYNNYLLTIDGSGILWRQPAYSTVNIGTTQVGSGFGDCLLAMCYPAQNPNSMLVLGVDGKLWYYPMSDDAVPGSRSQIGSGWDMYKQLVVSGNDILAIDNANDVYRYAFTPKGFYPLK